MNCFFRPFFAALSAIVFCGVVRGESDSIVYTAPPFQTPSTAENVTFLNLCIIPEDDSFYVSTYDRVAAAVDLAIANANSFILPKAIRLRTVFQSTGSSCSQVQHTVVTNILGLLRSGVTCHAYVGIGCATSAVAMYGIAEQYNVPIFGCPAAGASSLSLNATASRFPLLLRVPFSLSDIGLAFSTFFTRYNYSHLSVFRDDSNSFYSFTAKYIMNYFRNFHKRIYQHSLETPFTGADSTSQRRKAMLEEAKNRSRVILLLTHARLVRQFMIQARSLGLTQGDYVFFAIEPYELTYWGHIKFNQGDNDDTNAREAFQSLMVLSLSDSTGNGLDDNLAISIKIKAKEQYNYTFKALERPDPVVMGFYESIMIYAQEVNTMSLHGLDYRNGTALTRRIVGKEFSGITGALRIAKNGERDRDLDLKTFHPDTGQYKVAIQFLRYATGGANQTFLLIDPTLWFVNDGEMPPDEPRCGFRDDECREPETLPRGTLAVVVVMPLLVLLAVAGAATYAVMKLKVLRQDYNPDWWKIYQDDLTVKQNRTGSGAMSKKSLNSHGTTTGAATMSGLSGFNCDILGKYKNALVALTDVSVLEKLPTSEMISRFNVLKNATHPNLQHFIGIGLLANGRCQYVVAEACPKGSLMDMLNYSAIKLDWSFKNSLIKDVVFGMTYLHTSPMVSHGNLTGHNCLMDTRFTLKISDYGLPFFRDPAFLQPYRASESHSRENIEELLWRSPELLRQTMPAEGTQKGDVYSFAIILQQIILRSGPFELPNDPLEMSEHEILTEVISANIPPVRPRVPRAACSNELYDLMERCWEEIPVERPTFPKIKDRLKRVIGSYGDNIVDVLFKRMEQYALDLEIKVAEKTQQFMEEKSRSEQLLSQLLPKSVADALTRGEHVDPEAFESVSIYFSDIVGFTTIAAAGSPMGVVNLLNGLYTFFDGVLEKYDVYKVETIGDAYMVSSGLPVRNGNRHATEIASMSIALIKGIRSFTIPDRPGQDIQVRIGINSGPCVAGIVGLKMPRYCLFGDTVNVASRMESTGEAMKIQITQETNDLLLNIGGYRTTERGSVPIKGKGTLVTFWLLGGESEDALSGRRQSFFSTSVP
ncbi:Atrial natriuretic peptide receptor 1 [Hypsibius exemplaris]|uniref:Guanylate cyclase n=1 Tax=Hypsibius exemplaris TaxID=2072580 RepID=A0A1W0WAS6_HYPEX|nr:Atrial natriuretic peptide receptor 1 [Hypsibius exemplaris]